MSMRSLSTAVFLWLFATASEALAQCAMCKDALEKGADGPGSHLHEGISWAILLMLGLVFVFIPAGFALAIWRSYRKAANGRGLPSAVPPSGPVPVRGITE